jgi:hypothetical protein
MKNNNRYLHRNPIFPFLLCLFFVLHGFTANYHYIPVDETVLLLGIYLFFTGLLMGLAWILYRNWTKAALAAFWIMSFYFFFGSLHDTLKQLLPGTLFIKYSFLVPIFFALLLFLIIRMYVKKTVNGKLVYFLNLLFIIFLVLDTGSLITKMISGDRRQPLTGKEFIPCDSCAHPDVYFILADEYAGDKELKGVFQFDNSPFTDSLNALGFHLVRDSYSNYNYTPFSLASILDMNYLSLTDTNRTGTDLLYAYDKIRDNRLIPFFQSMGYRFYNYSIFNFEGSPARVQENFLPVRLRLITSQTFINRIQRDLGFNLITTFHSLSALKSATYSSRYNNEHIYDLTWKLAGEKTAEPKFVYTHLMMPHYPYFFDSSGNARPFDKLVEGSQGNKADYLSYLQYANKKLLALVNHILQSSSAPPLIILMGDHGFRHFTTPVSRPNYFLNLDAMYFPTKNYKGIRDSISMVNQFRIILNSQFNQKLPLLNDSTIYLKD